MNLQEIEAWLREDDSGKLEDLWRQADQVRAQNVGDAVHLRGLIEISNHCIRSCAYCGLEVGNREISRYRMTAEEILDAAREAAGYGYGTVVMQAGEDYGLKTDWLCDIVHRIKSELNLAVTLSLGERPYQDLEAFRQAGADRYLLRFETSDEKLYHLIHPSLPNKLSDRLEILGQLRELGYEVGSGVMIGIPGQTYAILARDIELFGKLDLDMTGVGPYIPGPDTALGRGDVAPKINPTEQVGNNELMTYKVVALTRIQCPQANIPSTTALATINKSQGRELGLQRGANVVMPNVTPVEYRNLYQIYPGKACLNETAAQCQGCMRRRIESIGRTLGQGHGGRRR